MWLETTTKYFYSSWMGSHFTADYLPAFFQVNQTIRLSPFILKDRERHYKSKVFLENATLFWAEDVLGTALVTAPSTLKDHSQP